MDILSNKTYRESIETAREIARKVVLPNSDKHDKNYSMPTEMLDAMHRSGLLKLCVPTELGGKGTGVMGGKDPLAFLLVIEEIGRIDMAAAHCFQVHSHSIQMLAHGGTKEQQARWFEPTIASGGVISWTGSEPGRTARGQYNLVSDAKRKNGGYVLNGIKNYGTNASIGTWNIISVSTEGMDPVGGFLMVVVPKGAKGMTVDESWWRPTGMRSCVSPKLILENLEVPDSDVLVGPGYYPKCQAGSRWHLGFGANHLGAAQGLLDFAVEYLPKRGTAGSPHTQRSLGEMRMRIAAARALLYQAAELWGSKDVRSAEELSLMAKTVCIGVAEWMVNETIRIVGTTALLETYPLPRMIRDIHVHSTHANLDNTAQSLGKGILGLSYDATQQQ